jgi:HlyD family secretion protein
MTASAASLRRNVAIGAAAAIALAGFASTLAFGVDLSGAVIANGLLVVDSNVKKVQHPTGGVVGELLVRNGDLVKAGQVVVRLDDTQVKANLAIVTRQLDELTARQARETAERDGDDAPAWPEDLTDRAADPDVGRMLAGETRLFRTRKEAREGQKSQMHEEIEGLEVQRQSRVDQIDWIVKELDGVRDLWKKNLVPYSKLTALERERSRLDGERGQLIAQIAGTRVKIVQVDQDMRTETGKDLAEIRSKIAELSERRISAEDQLRRIELKAPLGGIVHQSEVHTVGGVVTPGETLMLIVPEHDALTAEVRIQPQDIDQVRDGQPAWLKFSSFNQRTTPELTGEISTVSADVTTDQKTNANYYTVRIAIPADEIEKLGKLKLIAGMPVEAFIKTSDRSMISFLTRPMTDQIARAFREK